MVIRELGRGSPDEPGNRVCGRADSGWEIGFADVLKL